MRRMALLLIALLTAVGPLADSATALDDACAEAPPQTRWLRQADDEPTNTNAVLGDRPQRSQWRGGGATHVAAAQRPLEVSGTVHGPMRSVAVDVHLSRPAYEHRFRDELWIDGDLHYRTAGEAEWAMVQGAQPDSAAGVVRFLIADLACDAGHETSHLRLILTPAGKAPVEAYRYDAVEVASAVTINGDRAPGATLLRAGGR
jgi:hypothetical protein